MVLSQTGVDLTSAFGKGLAVDFRRGAAPATGLLGPLLTDEAAVGAMVAAVDARGYPRQEVSRAVTDYQMRLGADDAAVANARRLAEPAAFAVVGGQQAGLLSGPLYTIHKAVSIVRLALQLAGQTGRPCVPVFWVAGEDHDVAEVDHIHVPALHRPRRLRANLPQDQRSVSALGLNFWPEFRRDLGQALADLPHRQQALDLVDDAAAAAGNMADFFSALLLRLTAGTGMVCVESGLLRQAAAPIIQGELADAGTQTRRSLASASEQVKAAGYGPQLVPHDHTLSVFHYVDGRRSHLDVVEDGRIRARIGGRTMPPQEWAALVEREPDAFSPGVALRPVVQDFCLPVAVFVGGPSELAYYAQLRQLHDRFGAPYPLCWPRVSATLLEPETRSLADQAGLSVPDLFTDADALRHRFASQIPCAAAPRMTALEQEIGARVESLIGIACEQDPNLSRTGFKVLKKTMRDLAKFRDKACRAEQRARGIDPQTPDLLLNAIFPDGKPQERVLNLVPFLARHGLQLMDALLVSLDPLADSHQVLDLV